MSNIASNIFIFMILIPLLCVLCVSLINEKEFPNNVKRACIWTASFAFLLASGLLTMFRNGYNPQCSFLWMLITISDISIYLIELTAFLILLCIIIARSEVGNNIKKFFITILIMEFLLFLFFSTDNIVLFSILLELITFTAIFLLVSFSEKSAQNAKILFIIASIGAVLAFFGVSYVIFITNIAEIGVLYKYTFTNFQEYMIFSIFFIVFSCKSLLLPMYFWITGKHRETMTCICIILFGMIFTAGTFGMINVLLRVVPVACTHLRMVIFSISIIVMAYTVIFSILTGKDNSNNMLVIDSVLGIFVFHVSTVIFGIFSGNIYGITGAYFNMIAVVVATASLLAISRLVEDRATDENTDFSDGEKKSSFNINQNILMISIFPTLCLIFIPLFPCFIGEFLILYGCLIDYPTASSALVIMTAMSVLFISKIHGKLFFGVDSTRKISLTSIEFAYLAPIAIVILAMGIFPNNMIKAIESYVSKNILLEF